MRIPLLICKPASPAPKRFKLGEFKEATAEVDVYIKGGQATCMGTEVLAKIKRVGETRQQRSRSQQSALSSRA